MYSAKNLSVYVWWSAGRGDGDGYDETIEVTDEQYEVLKEIAASGEDLGDIEDPRIADDCKKWNEELLDALLENSMEYFEEDIYREDCLIDPNSDEYDPDGEEEQFSMSREEWWHEQYTTGVTVSEEFDYDEDEEE